MMSRAQALLALGMDGDPFVCIDNVTRPLGSAPLDGDQPHLQDRILAQDHKEVPMHAIFSPQETT